MLRKILNSVAQNIFRSLTALPEAVDILRDSFNDLDGTSILSSQISNKVITFKLTLTSITEITWDILSETGSLLASGTLPPTLVSDYAAGFVGGIFNNRSSSTTGNLKIDILQIREVYS